MIVFVGAGPGSGRSDHSAGTAVFKKKRTLSFMQGHW